MAGPAAGSQEAQQLQLAGGGEGALRFVEEVEAGDLIATPEVLQNPLPMRPRRQLGSTLVPGLTGIDPGHVVEELSPVPEPFGAEEAPAERGRGQRRVEVLGQRTDRDLTRGARSLGLAPQGHAALPGQRLHEGGLSRAVLAHEEGHGRVEAESLPACQGRDVEWVGLGVSGSDRRGCRPVSGGEPREDGNS